MGTMEGEKTNDTVTQTKKRSWARAGWKCRRGEQKQDWKKKKQETKKKKKSAELEKRWRWRWGCRDGDVWRVEAVMWAEGAVWHASSARLCYAFSAVIKEMFMLWMMPRRGERRAQYSTLRYTTLATPSRNLSAIFLPIRPPCPFLMSPSFLLPPLSFPARCIFGSDWQFSTAPHGSIAEEWWQAPPLRLPQLTALPQLGPQAKDTEDRKNMLNMQMFM